MKKHFLILFAIGALVLTASPAAFAKGKPSPHVKTTHVKTTRTAPAATDPGGPITGTCVNDPSSDTYITPGEPGYVLTCFLEADGVTTRLYNVAAITGEEFQVQVDAVTAATGDRYLYQANPDGSNPNG